MQPSDELDAAVVEGGILPALYIAGGVSPLPELPSEQIQAPMQYLFKLNDAGEYTYDADTGMWGQEPDSTYSVSYLLPDDGTPQELVINGFESSDGNTYILLSNNKSTYRYFKRCPVIWNLLNSLGAIQMDPSAL